MLWTLLDLRECWKIYICIPKIFLFPKLEEWAQFNDRREFPYVAWFVSMDWVFTLFDPFYTVISVYLNLRIIFRISYVQHSRTLRDQFSWVSFVKALEHCLACWYDLSLVKVQSSSVDEKFVEIVYVLLTDLQYNVSIIFVDSINVFSTTKSCFIRRAMKLLLKISGQDKGNKLFLQ